MFRFDEAEHRYTLGDQVLPSVTQILRCCYDFSAVPRETLEYKRQIGTAVHKAVELWLRDDLVEDLIPAEWSGYFSAWRAFVRDCNLRPADFGDVERPLYHPTYGYAGTPDMTLCLNGKWSVLDVKTTTEIHPAVALQVAAYQRLLNVGVSKETRLIVDRHALRLTNDGTYRLDTYHDKSDWTAFLSFLTTYRWRLAHGC